MSRDGTRLAATDYSITKSWVDGSWHRQKKAPDHGASSAPEGSARAKIAFPLAAIFDQAEELLLSKQDDYGPDNIAKSPFGPLNGLLVRMYDKQARAVNLLKGDGTRNYESLEDTFMDLLNYSAIAILCLRDQWPGTPRPDAA